MSTDVPSAPQPVLDDADTGEFFAGLADGQLRIEFCRDCASVVHLPQARCRVCGSWNVEWRVVSPTGVVYSWTVIERQVHPAFPVPYTLALIELDDAPGARIVGRLEGRADIAAGTAVRATFGEPSLPTWNVVSTDATQRQPSNARGNP